MLETTCLRSGLLFLVFLVFVDMIRPSSIVNISFGNPSITSVRNLIIDRDIPYPAYHGHVRGWDVGHGYA